MSLYRKYRPQNFVNLVGQEQIRVTLRNALASERVSHAYLFTGPRGTGKTSTARILAKAINCLNLQNNEPCEQCEICMGITEGSLIDVIEIDAASNRGIDEIRDLKEKITFAPTRARTKVYIIDEVHMLTKEAFNALLKTLEEPPAHVYFILATTEAHKIPETILSRCQRFDFRRIDDAVLMERLQFILDEEKIKAEPDALKLITHCAQGGMRDAISLMEQLIEGDQLTYSHACEVLGVGSLRSLDVLIDALLQFDGVKALQELELVYQEGHDLLQFNKNLLENLRKRLLQSVGGAPQITARLLKLIDLLRESYVNSKHAVIPQLPLEMAIIEGCLMVDAPVAAPQALASNISPTVTTQAVEAPSKATVQPVDQSPKAAATPVQPVARDAEPARDHQGLQPAEMKDLNFDQVKELWPQVLQQVKSSILKKTLPLGQILKVEGPTIFLGFTTNFHLSKVMEQTQRIELENVIEQLVGSQVKISAEIKDFGGIKKTAVASGLNSVPVEAVDEDTEKVLDMFGGEVM